MSIIFLYVAYSQRPPYYIFLDVITIAASKIDKICYNFDAHLKSKWRKKDTISFQ